MKRKNIFCLFISGLCIAIILACCATARQYDFSLKDTLSIFMLKNEKNSLICIPVQYMGDYHIGKFDFRGGNIIIGDYEIVLKRNEINISVYLNEAAPDDGNSVTGFNQVYLEENGKIILSKMNEPLTVTPAEDDGRYVHYYIFVERILADNEIKKISREYEKRNVNSRMSIEYDLVIDGEPQNGNGMMDDFELYDGPGIDPVWFPPNLNFFKARYPQLNIH